MGYSIDDSATPTKIFNYSEYGGISLVASTSGLLTDYVAEKTIEDIPSYVWKYYSGSAITVYAMWEAYTTTITLSSEDQSFTNSASYTSSATATYGASTLAYASTFVAPEKDGYTFNGWYYYTDKIINADGTLNTTDVEYYISSSLWIYSVNEFTNELTLTSGWTAKTTAVTFDFNDADTNGSPTTATFTFDSSTMGTAPTGQAKTGYSFKGFYALAEDLTHIQVTNDYNNFVSADGYTILDGSGFTYVWHSSVASITLYAIWEANTYNIDLNYGVASPNKDGNGSDIYSVAVTYKEVVSTLLIPSATGYTFNGWYTDGYYTTLFASTDGTVQTVAGLTDGDKKWIGTSNSYICARWTANTIAVTLDKGAGSVDGSATVIYDSKYLTSVTGPTAQANYEIEGFYVDAGLTTKIADTNYQFLASVEGYTDAEGKWKKDVTPITLYTKYQGVTVGYSEGALTGCTTRSGTDSPRYNAIFTATYSVIDGYTTTDAVVTVKVGDTKLVVNTDYTVSSNPNNILITVNAGIITEAVTITITCQSLE